MKKWLLLFAAITLVDSSAMAQSPTSTPPRADNTAQNARDRDTSNPTAGDQANNQSDLNLAQSIRKSVIAEKGLSLNAKNCKIIVSAGAVTLRGPVDSEDERRHVFKIAQAAAGKGKVTNDLMVNTAAK